MISGRCIIDILLNAMIFSYRSCVGRNVAIMELLISIATIFHKYHIILEKPAEPVSHFQCRPSNPFFSDRDNNFLSFIKFLSDNRMNSLSSRPARASCANPRDVVLGSSHAVT